MDSITQAALGAAVGHAAGGKTAGRKALLVGAIAGTIPDLDVLAYPFIDNVAQLSFHRGVSHSFFFAFAAAPLFGWITSRLSRSDDVPTSTWSWIYFWAFLTHSLLDTCTVYGTGLYEPFSNFRAALNLIFIIDPLYTIPLLAGTIAALILGRSKRALRWNWIGIALSSIYLLGWAPLAKWQADSAIKTRLAEEGVEYQRYISMPTPINTVLWRALVETEDGYFEYFHSVLAPEQQYEPGYIARNRHLVEPIRDSRAVKKLLWFSKGYFSARIVDGELWVSDLRFGRVGLEDGPPAFSWRIIEGTPPELDRAHPTFEGSGDAFKELRTRIFGTDPLAFRTDERADHP